MAFSEDEELALACRRAMLARRIGRLQPAMGRVRPCWRWYGLSLAEDLRSNTGCNGERCRGLVFLDWTASSASAYGYKVSNVDETEQNRELGADAVYFGTVR